MPADNVHGMRADTLALLKELDSPVYRWPGGNFVSGYNWRTASATPTAGRRARTRPGKASSTTTSASTSSWSSAALLNTEPYIAVNSGLGDVAGAVEEVQYANGRRRHAHGQAAGRRTATPSPTA